MVTNGKANRRRGADHERATVNWLRARGIPAERTSDGRAQLDGDVLGLPGVHLELKNCARLDLAGWVDSTRAAASPGALPIVLVRRRGVADRGSDYAVIAFSDLVDWLTDQPPA